jgi:predicted Zn-dependent protease
MNRKTIAIIALGLVLLACLLACGYFGAKTVRRTRLRRAAMTAYENKQYALAEKLLLQYVGKDPNAEAEFAALANIYHEFGNTGLETQMWQTASSLNPLNPEYYEKMLTGAVKSASYPLLHSILGRKAKQNEALSDQELYLYVISSYRSGYMKDGDNAYQEAVKNNPEAFHKSGLGRMAEFMVNYSNLSEEEQDTFLDQAMQSEAPVIRFEALFTAISRLSDRPDEDNSEEIEKLLKQAAETNYYAGTLLLADFYFSEYRFADAIAVLEPYLKTIDNLGMYLLYAESCVFEGKLDELKELERKLRRKPGSMPLMADYCEILIAYLEDDETKLAATVRKSGKLINSPLSRFMRLRVALSTGAFNEIRNVAQEIFSAQPFHDLHARALLVCMDYISEEMKKSENRNDLSQMADLAKILSGYLQGNRLLTEIIVTDQYKKGLAKEADLTTALDQFPDDAVLQRITAEYLILNGKPEQALDIVEPLAEAGESDGAEMDHGILFLYMLALDQLGRRDEASTVFLKLVEQTEFDLDLLNQYFLFCVKDRRGEDLASMANKLETVKDGKLEHYGKFFRAAAWLATEDKDKEKEALDLLASAPTGDPEFTFYAANRLCEHNRLDEAETKYKAILKTFRTPSLIYVNLSELYREKGDEQKALDAAKTAFELEKKSMLPAFIYAKRLSEAERYDDAVKALNFPRRAVSCREDVIELWTDCMRHVIEKNMAEQKYSQAEDQLKHLLVISPDDNFGKETMEKIRKILKPSKNKTQKEDAAADPAPAA